MGQHARCTVIWLWLWLWWRGRSESLRWGIGPRHAQNTVGYLESHAYIDDTFAVKAIADHQCSPAVLDRAAHDGFDGVCPAPLCERPDVTDLMKVRAARATVAVDDIGTDCSVQREW